MFVVLFPGTGQGEHRSSVCLGFRKVIISRMPSSQTVVPEDLLMFFPSSLNFLHVSVKDKKNELMRIGCTNTLKTKVRMKYYFSMSVHTTDTLLVTAQKPQFIFVSFRGRNKRCFSLSCHFTSNRSHISINCQQF